MADVKKNQKADAIETTQEAGNTKSAEPAKELNLDQKVTVKSIAAWITTFQRRAEGWGDITIMPHGNIRLSRNEIIAQVQSNNKLFCGIDGEGSHATLIIEDEATRREVGFEDDNRKQQVFSDDLVNQIFAAKSQNSFENELKRHIVTRAEKYSIIEAIKRLGINDFSKIRYVEEYTGYRV